MRSAALALTVALLAAGCLAPITERLRAGNVEEPRWDVGDWWRYTVASDTIDLAGEVTIVVAEVRPDGYILGIPPDAEANAALLYHMPPIGPIGSDLAWDVHETRFEPARWPLREGESWDTTWISATVNLTSRLDGAVWRINNSGYETESGMRYELVYDPAVENFASFVRTGIDGVMRQSIQLVGSGAGYTGELRAPRFVEVAFLDSRTQTVLQGGLPAAPNPKFAAPDSADTLLVGCLAGGAPGQYHAEVIAPAGGICALDATIPPDDALIRANVVEVSVNESDPDRGEWEARLLAAGTGAATVEVLAWPELEYTLGDANATA